MTKIIIDLVLMLISAWTLGYHLTFFTRLPFYWAVIFALAFLLIILFLYYKFSGGFLKLKKLDASERPVHITVAVMALLLGLFSAFTTGTNGDTIGYFSNPIIQAYNLRSPIYLISKGVAFNPPLPMLSGPHAMISLEPLYALIGRVTRIGPGVVYQTFVPFFIGIFTIICLYYVFTQLRMKRWEVVAALLSVLVFLVISGEGNQYGNWLLLLNYRGKAFLPATFIPVYLVSLYQYLQNPNKKDFFLLSLYGVAFIGAATTGPVFAVVMIFAASIAYLIAYGFSRTTLTNVVKLIPTSIYPVFFLGAYYFGLPPLTFAPSGSDAVVSTWYQEITERLFTNDTIIIAYGLILFVIPLFLLRKKEGIFYSFYSLIIFLLFANNIFGQLVIEVAQRANQWRMYYLLPTLIMIGFLPRLIERGIRTFRAEKQPTLLIFGLLIIFTLSIGSENHIAVNWKDNLFDYTIEPQYQHFLDEYDISKFSDSVVLPTDNISIALVLDNPYIRYYSIRSFYSLIFADAYDLPELMSRANFQLGIKFCAMNRITKDPDAVSYLVDSNVDYILYENCDESFTNNLLDLLAENGSYWEIDQYVSAHPADEGFVVWVLERK